MTNITNKIEIKPKIKKIHKIFLINFYQKWLILINKADKDMIFKTFFLDNIKD